MQSQDRHYLFFIADLLSVCKMNPGSCLQHIMVVLVLVVAKLLAICTEKDGAAILFPKENNIHELCAMDGLASFLDILSPPYKVDGDISLQRDCHYYNEVKTPDSVGKDLNALLRVPCPSSFTCSRLPYCGPNMNHLYKIFPI